jgi:hypothetical protein
MPASLMVWCGVQQWLVGRQPAHGAVDARRLQTLGRGQRRRKGVKGEKGSSKAKRGQVHFLVQGWKREPDPFSLSLCPLFPLLSFPSRRQPHQVEIGDSLCNRNSGKAFRRIDTDRTKPPARRSRSVATQRSRCLVRRSRGGLGRGAVNLRWPFVLFAPRARPRGRTARGYPFGPAMARS